MRLEVAVATARVLLKRSITTSSERGWTSLLVASSLRLAARCFTARAAFWSCSAPPGWPVIMALAALPRAAVPAPTICEALTIFCCASGAARCSLAAAMTSLVAVAMAFVPAIAAARLPLLAARRSASATILPARMVHGFCSGLAAMRAASTRLLTCSAVERALGPSSGACVRPASMRLPVASAMRRTTSLSRHKGMGSILSGSSFESRTATAREIISNASPSST
mmetsp:Transcript_7736/g.32590  ORF Transcript_7736/g.32590 Transcript_7736/m.32590 type:complete len:225 (-) Transcript_7736:2136-2810(-)